MWKLLYKYNIIINNTTYFSWHFWIEKCKETKNYKHINTKCIPVVVLHFSLPNITKGQVRWSVDIRYGHIATDQERKANTSKNWGAKINANDPQAPVDWMGVEKSRPELDYELYVVSS